MSCDRFPGIPPRLTDQRHATWENKERKAVFDVSKRMVLSNLYGLTEIGESPLHGVEKEILPAMAATILFSNLNTSHTKPDNLNGGDGKAVTTIFEAEPGKTPIKKLG